MGRVEKRVVVDGEVEEEVDEHGGSSDMSSVKHTLLTIMIVASGFTIAYFVDDLQMGACFLADIDPMY